MKPDGMSIPRLLRLFPDDETAKAWFAQARWKSGGECPHCRSHRIKIGPAHPTMPYRCRDCNKYFSVKINSVMQSSKLGATGPGRSPSACSRRTRRGSPRSSWPRSSTSLRRRPGSSGTASGRRRSARQRPGELLGPAEAGLPGDPSLDVPQAPAALRQRVLRRHNIRKLGVLERMESVDKGMCGKRLLYRDLVG